MLFSDLCLSPSAPAHRQRNGNRVALQQPSVRHSGQLIPSPRSTPTSRSATNCSPKPRSFGRRQNSRAQPWRMILCWDASNRRGCLTRLSVYPTQMPFGNANAAKSSETELPSFARARFKKQGTYCAARLLAAANPSGGGSISIAAPHHRDRRRQTAAHVEGEITPRAWNLSRTSLVGKMLIRFEHLAHPGRANRMTITN